jgi:glutamate/tyrosine decarboxylase-like PLP-dependent enzyme
LGGVEVTHMTSLDHGTRIESERRTPLDIDATTFRALGHRLVDDVAAFLESLPARPVTRSQPPSGVREALGLGGPLPERGTDPAVLLQRTASLLFDHSLLNGHPRFYGYITSSPAPIGILAELLAAAVNANVGPFVLSPAATEVESETVRWIAEFIGYPDDCGGLLVSGGNMANMVCFLAARAAQATWNVREQGVLGGGGRTLRVYCSSETHTWISKAADLAGIGTAAIRLIPTDADLRLDVDELQRQIDADASAGDLPFLVVGTAGSVSTGTIDPLRRIAAVCKQRDLWFHVDGAYGGFAAAVPGVPDDLQDLVEADSVAVDPHKWLYAPLEAGCALVKQPEALRNAFTYHPPYYHFAERATNYVDYGPQNSRGFRALKVWLAFQHAGAAGYRAMIAEDMALSRAMADAVARHPECELMTQALSITTFRYVPTDLRSTIGDPETERQLDGLNRALLDRIQKSGETFVSNAVINGRYALRACIVNFHTTKSDVEALPETVARIGRVCRSEL